MSEATPEPGEIWKHFKGGEYKIVTISFKADKTKRASVVYTDAAGTDWDRFLDEWREWVPNPNQVTRDMVPRYKRIMTADGNPC